MPPPSKEGVLDKVNFSNKVVLVMGAEGSGLRKLVKEHCDQLITIPNSGAMSTLNVSNAAAISLFLAQKRD